jgi:hypothetical protein
MWVTEPEVFTPQTPMPNIGPDLEPIPFTSQSLQCTSLRFVLMLPSHRSPLLDLPSDGFWEVPHKKFVCNHFLPYVATCPAHHRIQDFDIILLIQKLYHKVKICEHVEVYRNIMEI